MTRKLVLAGTIGFGFLLFLGYRMMSESASSSYPTSIRLRISQNQTDISARQILEEEQPDTTNTSYGDFDLLQHGQYYVLANMVKGSARFGLKESITFATPTTFPFIDNLDHLVDRWHGPISVGLYAPGDDFGHAMAFIEYLRKCKNPLIRERVDFHLFFEAEHMPKNSLIRQTEKSSIDCTKEFIPIDQKDSYQRLNKLTFPINVARNIAKEQSKTHFIFIADIELNPTPKNFVELFLDFAKRREDLFVENDKRVFVLPFFEIPEDVAIPDNKTELLALYNSKKAFIFHDKLCRPCHEVPGFQTWLETEESEDSLLGIIGVFKRHGKYRAWEPFFVGTKNVPFFDERISWEGTNDKIIQNYLMCLNDYDYVILSNAFIVHNPGIKTSNIQIQKYYDIVSKTAPLRKNYLRQYTDLLGNNDNC